MHQILLPKIFVTNNASSNEETLFAISVNFAPLDFLVLRWLIILVDILYGYVHGLCLPLPLISLCPSRYILGVSRCDNDVVLPLLILYIGILLPILNVPLDVFGYVIRFCIFAPTSFIFLQRYSNEICRTKVRGFSPRSVTNKKLHHRKKRWWSFHLHKS